MRDIIKRVKSLVLLTGIIVLLSMAQLTWADDPVPLDVEDVLYGEHAISYLNAIVSSFPNRECAKGASAACGDWIIGKLQNMGYDVAIHEFKTKDGAQTGRNIIVERYGASDKTLVICAHYDSADTQGCDDNASGTAVLLEIAQRISRMKALPESNLRIIFFDDEEEGPWGSQMYCNSQSEEYFKNLIGVINIDSIAAGDNMYIHGGTFEGTQTELRDIALAVAGAMSLDMTTHPEVNYIPAGTRVNGSDQRYFAERGVPYVYFEANVYSNQAADGLPMHYQTANPAVPGGQIMHTAYDDIAVIEGLFPGRIASYLKAYTELTLALAYNMTENGQYSGKYFLPFDMNDLTTEAETTEKAIEKVTEKETTETAKETTETAKETTEKATKPTEAETGEQAVTTVADKTTGVAVTTEKIVPVTLPTVVQEKTSGVKWIWIIVAVILVSILASAVFILFRIYNKMNKKKKRKKKKR